MPGFKHISRNCLKFPEIQFPEVRRSYVTPVKKQRNTETQAKKKHRNTETQKQRNKGTQKHRNAETKKQSPEKNRKK